jgi:hypothetical protein
MRSPLWAFRRQWEMMRRSVLLRGRSLAEGLSGWPLLRPGALVAGTLTHCRAVGVGASIVLGRGGGQHCVRTGSAQRQTGAGVPQDMPEIR